MMNNLKSLGIGFLCLMAVLLPVVAVKATQISTLIASGANPPAMLETIAVFKAVNQQWPNNYKSIGTVEASEGIVISAEVAGKVQEIQFNSGAQVKKGAVILVQESENERAQLSAAQARLRLAQTNYERLSQLRTKNTVSESELDAAQQQVESAQGDTDNLKATLEKKLVRAPFDGRLGIRKVSMGEDLRVGAEIVSLQATNAVRVNFLVPQFWLPKIKKGLAVTIEADGLTETFNGEVTAIAAEINPVTRSAGVQAFLLNAGNTLIPGMAVSTKVTLADPTTLLAVPSTAVIFSSSGDTLFIIEENDKGELVARQQFVKLGKARGDFVEIITGLQEGEQVAIAGAFKLRNGQAVIISELPTPDFKIDPTAKDS